MSELKSALVRQLHSLNIQPGTPEFDKFIRERLWRPEVNILQHFKPQANLDFEVMAGMMELLYYEFESLLEYEKKCKRNKGITKIQFIRANGITEEQMKSWDNKCIKLMVTNYKPSELLDGSDGLYCPESPIQGKATNWNISL